MEFSSWLSRQTQVSKKGIISKHTKLITNEDRIEGLILIVEERWVLKSIIIAVVNWQVKHRTEVCYGLQQ